jgi:hypothetical protein
MRHADGREYRPHPKGTPRHVPPQYVRPLRQEAEPVADRHTAHQMLMQRHTGSKPEK